MSMADEFQWNSVHGLGLYHKVNASKQACHVSAPISLSYLTRRCTIVHTQCE